MKNLFCLFICGVFLYMVYLTYSPKGHYVAFYIQSGDVVETYYGKANENGIFSVYNWDMTETNDYFVPEDNWGDEPMEYKVYTDYDLQGYLYETEVMSNIYEFHPL